MRTPIAILLALTMLLSATAEEVSPEAMHALALEHRNTLALSAYITAANVRKLASEDLGRVESLTVLHGMGITKVYLEVYRSGTVLTPEELTRVRDFYEDNDFAVAGAIATVPGGDFGVRQDRGLGWFNSQSEKTQRDLEAVVRMAAPLFNEFIVDDFLCTDDKSPESEVAKGDRSWGEYRRDLLVALSQKIFIDPAKEENPDITMIIKYPQWYDRFHLFGYDVERQPQLFDKVYVGTETRGARTQRFGYIQPYLGFVNYRWLAEIAGDKIGGAWFDHGDCDAHDFVDQAWQTVLAGAKEIVLFNYGNLAAGHPGHQLLRNDFAHLAKLAAVVAEHPVVGIPAYKPMNSDPAGDMYLMDFLGMLGIPLVPTAEFPEDADTIFLPASAADDPEIESKLEVALNKRSNLVLTAGFLVKLKHSNLHRIAGLANPVVSSPLAVHSLENARYPEIRELQPQDPFMLEAKIQIKEATQLVIGNVAGEKIPFLTIYKNRHYSSRTPHGDPLETPSIVVLNVHTYDQQDFDAVDEVLLAPTPLGILELDRGYLGTIHGVYSAWNVAQDPRITVQPLADGTHVIQNYNDGAGFLVMFGSIHDVVNQKMGLASSCHLEPHEKRWFRYYPQCHLCGV